MWPRVVRGTRVVLLLGAFDPVTNAHLDIARAASRALDAPAALCLTKVLLARSGDALLDPDRRVCILDAVAERCGLGFALANRGTYVEVGRALRSDGVDAVFAIGSDKLSQLSDPSFYADGDDGVRSTFDELSFLVVPREGAPLDRDDVDVLDPAEVFRSNRVASTSATEVRRLVSESKSVDDLVPPEVVLALGGYTRT